MHEKTILGIPGIGKRYAVIIGEWQGEARFSPEVEYAGPMIVSDAKRVLELLEEIAALDVAIEGLSQGSALVKRIDSIPGFGKTSSAELAGEIGTFVRFSSEASLALYLGMCPLDRQSGQFRGTKSPRQVNWRAKAAMMVAGARHIEQVPESRMYYEKKRVEGKNHNQAIRALGRHMVRVMWSMMRQGRDYEVREATCLTRKSDRDVQVLAYGDVALPAWSYPSPPATGPALEKPLPFRNRGRSARR
ncbi:IS110 family transposase [Candidatus Bipolaricaulota bacterium]|nr:IS110 family transposase [Candidatus Bipolaricaulota bacterium]